MADPPVRTIEIAVETREVEKRPYTQSCRSQYRREIHPALLLERFPCKDMPTIDYQQPTQELELLKSFHKA